MIAFDVYCVAVELDVLDVWLLGLVRELRLSTNLCLRSACGHFGMRGTVCASGFLLVLCERDNGCNLDLACFDSV